MSKSLTALRAAICPCETVWRLRVLPSDPRDGIRYVPGDFRPQDAMIRKANARNDGRCWCRYERTTEQAR